MARVLPIFVVVPPRVLLLDLAGPVEVLRKTNLLQADVRFEVTFVGPRRKVGSSVGLGIEGIAPMPPRLPEGAMVVVPGHADEPMGGSRETPEDNAAAEQAIVHWLATVVHPGIRVMSICSGAMLVGRAGLLDGFECTTHHANTAELAAEVPGARVRENRLYVEDGERLSSAGITSGIDLMLHVVAGLAGPAIAVAVARFLVVYLRRAGGDPQLSPWLEGRNHMHPVIHRAQDAVAANPARAWSVDALAQVAAASPRHLSRLFNEHAGMSVSEYVNRMRLALARELLAESRLDMEAVAERSGFGSTRQLRRAWARNHALPPSQFRGEVGRS
ncbi:helix-turn-helix domain-containing protein [Luteibacter aegosomaticola]|uniref:GlxA family transcriptional regulator n=1 Tax=Luteibacter aegosomaticola TaxID=2911538 RepID=UPI001FF755E8|nr:helix-turn-helix domain-containing protein [Luteibacter aegosomaticola]UPG88569.1 helix-turn-helix domain-containing protein [Luteibacter aegosomaticola]